MKATKATKAEQRWEERVVTELPVDLGQASGVTRNVSASGVFFETEATYAIKSPISFTVELNTSAGRMIMKCEGEIVRIERRDAKVGVAVKIIESTIEPVR